MELQCKIGGKGLRKKGGVVNEDRISELPEVLLLLILSSLPTATAIATSVLSKRWKSLWKMLPNLKFDSGYRIHSPFSDSNLSRTLILHKAPVLESLHLNVGDRCNTSEMKLWIGIALARQVRKLVLELYSGEKGPVKFPDTLCRFNNTLKFLKLEGSILLNLTSPVCLTSLRELHLRLVEFKNEESVSNLLCYCPCLEDLVVKRECIADSLQTFTIAVPSLQRLTIADPEVGGAGGGYVINSPSLKYLKLKWLDGLEFILFENAPELVEAKINKVCDIDDENILLSLKSAKRLSINLRPSDIKYPSGIIFYRWSCVHMKESGGIYFRSCLIVLLNYKVSSSSIVSDGNCAMPKILWMAGTGSNRNLYQNVCCSILRHWCDIFKCFCFLFVAENKILL